MWFIYAIIAAVLWGLSYTLYGQLLKHVSSLTTALLSVAGGLVIYMALQITQGGFAKEVAILKSNPSLIQMSVAVMVINAAACLFLFASIKASNATLAGLIEITYPLFTALFTYLLLRENTMNIGTVAGAVLIFSGITCIYHFNKTV